MVVAQYTYKGWSDLPTYINNLSIAKIYEYMAIFYNDKEEIVYQEWVQEGDTIEDPVETGKNFCAI